MIDRKTALACAALIALMLMAAGWRIGMLNDWTTLPISNAATLPSLALLFLPACAALVTGAFYWETFGAKTTDDTKLRPWREWGGFVAIPYCATLLLLQGAVIAASLGIDMPLSLADVSRASSILMPILSIAAINQMPKLPWFERRFSPGGDLGPIYGPRYMRIQSRILVAFVLATTAFNLTAPPSMGWRTAVYTLLATALLVVQAIVWRRHLGHKWKLEQMATGG
jgi:hypothetical protein